MIDRRAFIATVTASVLAGALVVEAQRAASVARIGVLISGSPSTHKFFVDTLRHALRELGYVEGQNTSMEFRWAEGKLDRFPVLAAELVRLNVDVIVTAGSPAVRALKEATSTIPVVVAGAADLVGAGLVSSLARPGGNITGYMEISPELSGKRLQLLKETFPALARVAVLWSPATPDTGMQLRQTDAAARALGVQLRSHEVHGPEDFPSAYAAMGTERVDAVIIIQNSVALFHRRQLLDLATKSKLPMMCEAVEFARDGCLIAYGSDRAYMLRRGAVYVDKILKGAKPADLPIEQPTKFELVINLKTAKALGLTIPASVLARADQVIQ